MRLLIFFFITTQVFSQINWTSFNTSTSDIPYNQVKALEFDANGNLFVGTAYGLGILNIENNSWDVYFNDYPDIGLIDNDIINISKSLTDSMWICTTNGISIFFNAVPNSPTSFFNFFVNATGDNLAKSSTWGWIWKNYYY